MKWKNLRNNKKKELKVTYRSRLSVIAGKDFFFLLRFTIFIIHAQYEVLE